MIKKALHSPFLPAFPSLCRNFPDEPLLGSSVASVDLMMDDIKPGPSVLESFRHLAC
jgi:hypothetical protein